MYTSVFTALFMAVAALAQGPQINTPAAVIQCQPTKLTWSGGSPPYWVTVIPAGDVSAAPLMTLADNSQSTEMTWIVNLAPNTNISLSIRDGTGSVQYSSPIVIQAGSSTDCMNASAGASGSGGAVAGASGGPTATGAASGSPAASPSASGSPAASGSSSAAASASSSPAASSATSKAASATSAAASAMSSAASAAGSAASGAAAGASSAAAAATPGAAGALSAPVIGAAAVAAAVIAGI